MKRFQSIAFGHASNRRGAVAVLTALLMVVLLAMVAFSVDIGYIVHVDTELQRTADGCAIAAVLELPDQAEAITMAQAVAQDNKKTAGPDLEVSDLVFGVWDRDTATFTATSIKPNAARVTLRRTRENDNPLRLFFAPILGIREAGATASATAMFDRKLCGPLIGIDWVSVPGGPTTDSYRSSDGSYSNQTPRDNGDLCSDGYISLEGEAIVNGDANPGKGHQTTNTGSSIVTGNTSPRLRPLNLPPVDDTEISQTNDNDDLPLIQKGNNLISPVDQNGNFLLDGGQTYDMPPGRYYFNDMTLSGQSQLNISGDTTIYLTGNLDTSGGDVVNSTQIPSKLGFFMTDGWAKVTSSVDFYGVVYGPNADVTLEGSAQFFGAAVGQTLEATGSGDIHYDEDLGIQDEVTPPKRIALVQ